MHNKLTTQAVIAATNLWSAISLTGNAEFAIRIDRLTEVDAADRSEKLKAIILEIKKQHVNNA